MRMDMIIRHTDGGYIRIHPGSKMKQDAQPKFFPAETLAGGAAEHAGEEWNTPGPNWTFTWERAKEAPQGDLLGKKESVGYRSTIAPGANTSGKRGGGHHGRSPHSLVALASQPREPFSRSHWRRCHESKALYERQWEFSSFQIRTDGRHLH